MQVTKILLARRPVDQIARARAILADEERPVIRGAAHRGITLLTGHEMGKISKTRRYWACFAESNAPRHRRQRRSKGTATSCSESRSRTWDVRTGREGCVWAGPL
jgi:hypothetical protein